MHFFSFQEPPVVSLPPLISQEEVDDLLQALGHVVRGRYRDGQLLRGGVSGFLRELGNQKLEISTDRLTRGSFHDYFRPLVPNSPFLRPPAPLPTWLR